MQECMLPEGAQAMKRDWMNTDGRRLSGKRDGLRGCTRFFHPEFLPDPPGPQELAPYGEPRRHGIFLRIPALHEYGVSLAGAGHRT